MEVADHYRSQREELTSLGRGLDQEQLAKAVPGCPLWDVRQAFSHLVGLTADVCSGTMENAGSPAWTQAQVDARAGASMDELLQEWTERSVGFEEALPGMGFTGWVFTYDIAMHGDDIREALGLPLGTSETHAVVLDGLIDRARTRADGLGTLTLHAGARSWTLGSGSPSASLTVADEGELGRVIGARRSDDVVRGLDWTGDPESWIGVLPLFREGR